jgi:glycosyltransferase involved in cell wall biosynthesis
LKRKNIEKLNNKKIKLKDITVLIPFRNEENRLKGLLNSIQNAKSHPKSYIFIDDHSKDQSQTLIKKHLQGIKFEIVTLPEVRFGKKRALEKGITHVTTEFVLTLDADVTFEEDYFNHISQLDEHDLIILPVKHDYHTHLNGFFQQDVVLANLINLGIAGWKRPILCSGANLMYRKNTFLKVTSNSNFFDSDSGDDVFLMQSAQNENLSVLVEFDKKLSVKTLLPEGLYNYLHQRLRWIGKSKKVGDQLSNSLAIIQFVLSISNWFVIMTVLIFLSTNQIITFLVLKTGIEWGSTFSYYRDQNEFKIWIFIPIYILLLPIINCIIIFSSFFIKPKWKNRLVVQ